jgi:hypothetical protein
MKPLARRGHSSPWIMKFTDQNRSSSVVVRQSSFDRFWPTRNGHRSGAKTGQMTIDELVGAG